jgi:hypothetical protein
MELHTACVEEVGTTIAGHHLWFYNMMMRAVIQEHDLVGLEVAFCKGCHETFSEQILANYKMMERFDEGARFLEEFGWADEDVKSSRGPKRTRVSSRIPKRTRGPRGNGGSVRAAG